MLFESSAFLLSLTSTIFFRFWDSALDWLRSLLRPLIVDTLLTTSCSNFSTTWFNCWTLATFSLISFCLLSMLLTSSAFLSCICSVFCCSLLSSVTFWSNSFWVLSISCSDFLISTFWASTTLTVSVTLDCRSLISVLLSTIFLFKSWVSISFFAIVLSRFLLLSFCFFNAASTLWIDSFFLMISFSRLCWIVFCSTISDLSPAIIWLLLSSWILSWLYFCFSFSRVDNDSATLLRSFAIFPFKRLIDCSFSPFSFSNSKIEAFNWFSLTWAVFISFSSSFLFSTSIVFWLSTIFFWASTCFILTFSIFFCSISSFFCLSNCSTFEYNVSWTFFVDSRSTTFSFNSSSSFFTLFLRFSRTCSILFWSSTFFAISSCFVFRSSTNFLFLVDWESSSLWNFATWFWISFCSCFCLSSIFVRLSILDFLSSNSFCARWISFILSLITLSLSMISLRRFWFTPATSFARFFWFRNFSPTLSIIASFFSCSLTSSSITFWLFSSFCTNWFNSITFFVITFLYWATSVMDCLIISFLASVFWACSFETSPSNSFSCFFSCATFCIEDTPTLIRAKTNITRNTIAIVVNISLYDDQIVPSSLFSLFFLIWDLTKSFNQHLGDILTILMINRSYVRDRSLVSL